MQKKAVAIGAVLHATDLHAAWVGLVKLKLGAPQLMLTHVANIRMPRLRLVNLHGPCADCGYNTLSCYRHTISGVPGLEHAMTASLCGNVAAAAVSHI